MKKIIALLLATAVCLSLIACGNQTPDTNNSGEAPEKTISNLSSLCGEWKPLSTEPNAGVQSISAREDNTISVDERTLTWQADLENDNLIQISLYDGENRVGFMYVNFLENGEISGSLDLDTLTDDVFLYKPSEYEVIDLSLENWQTYFEISEKMHYRDNAFGEAESCFLRIQLQLKEDYQDRISTYTMADSSPFNIKENGAVESSFDVGERKATIDLATRTHTLGQVIPTETRTHTDGFSYDGDENCLYSGLDTVNIGGSEIENGMLSSASANFKITRIQGTFCLRTK